MSQDFDEYHSLAALLFNLPTKQKKERERVANLVADQDFQHLSKNQGHSNLSLNRTLASPSS